jgi:predicted dehydrogenase
MQELDLDYKPKLPKNKSMGLAIIGAGEIIEACHLPAYQMAGFRILGIFDVQTEKAQKLADKFQIPKVYRKLDELLDDSQVEIVDIAIPAKFQPQVVEQVVAKKKHVLCQKPLAENYGEAKRIVDMCNAANVKAAVNQQMRWSPGIQASHTIIKRGWLGELTQASIQVNVLTDFANWTWMKELDRVEITYHSIHYLDSIRYLLGTPEYIYADGAKFPGQALKGETRTMIHMKFPGDARGLVHDNHNHIANQEDWYATFRIEGTKGIIKGTNGALYNYPVGREDTFSYYSKIIDPTYWFSPRLEGKWFPHAFMGTMGELMRSIEEEREPSNSVQDNLLTLQIVYAAYRSMEENRPVYLEEIASGR